MDEAGGGLRQWTRCRSAKLFDRTLFSFLVGNEDMHLKNFSLITRNAKVELSPAYDLVNTTVALANAQEELALPLNGKKRNIRKNDLVVYFAGERLSLLARAIDDRLKVFKRAVPEWLELVGRSFLPPETQARFKEIVTERALRLEL